MLRPTRAVAIRQPLRQCNPLQIKASYADGNTSIHSAEKPPGKKKAIVIGSGFAGLGAAWSLSGAGAEVLLLDGAPQPGGLSAAIKTPQGRVVEPGIKGFWYQYANLTRLVTELNLREADVFTPYTEVSAGPEACHAGPSHALKRFVGV